MNISYNWLKNYIDFQESPEELAAILTQIGLETGNIENFDSVKGGLKGFVIGKVLSCVKHPNADKLSITKVDIGQPEILNIVCGAPNVAEGQKVIVATVGTIIYGDNDSFEIKKAKIRGEESSGMICAEDEMGLGTSHAGIMVLPQEAVVGTKASDYFNVESDHILEVDLTPNRIDAASHIGVARDIAAFKKIAYNFADISAFKISKNTYSIDVEVKDAIACPRYSGICMDNIKVGESPEWLKNKLKAIGLNPINNIVDITNFVLHETGHPLHAFDGDKIEGNKIIVNAVVEGTKFITLDGIERSLQANDLMICHKNSPMCIAGVFGGIDAGINTNTKKIFIESAYFNPVWVRKTAKHHGISTDSSFRFERGADINMTLYAVKRAATLIEEMGIGSISSDLTDIYPDKFIPNKVEFNYDRCNALIGKDISKEQVKTILKSLEIKILEEKENNLILEIPSYRVDVLREADVVEDILRIYGYDNIEIPEKVYLSLNTSLKPDSEKLLNSVSDLLVNQGFNEIMCNSLISGNLFNEDDQKSLVKLCNPLSNDLNVMRPSPIFGGLESIAYNINRKAFDIKFFEFGRTYHADLSITDISNIKRYSESRFLGLWISGKRNQLSWNMKDNPTDFFLMKSYLTMICARLGVEIKKLNSEIISDKHFSYAQYFYFNNIPLLKVGLLNVELTKKFDINQEIYYSEVNWDLLLEVIKNKEIKHIPVSKFPKVKRDLALLIDKNVSYKQLTEIAYSCEPSLLKEINLFDVYEGKNLEAGKVSYALSFTLEDREKTMTDVQIEKIMQKLIKSFETQLDAKLR